MRNVLLILVFAATLVGCSGGMSSLASITGGSGGSSNGLSGLISAGPISGATVSVYALNPNGTRGALLGSAISDGSGNYSVNVSANAGPVVIEAVGGSYNEEADGSSQTNTTLRTVLPSYVSGQAVGITPVTEIAAAQVEGSAIGATTINDVNSAVATVVGLTDITKPPAKPDLSGSPSVDEKKYAIVLGAISQMGVNSSKTSIQIASALSGAYSNGSFNPSGSLGSILAASGGTSFGSALTAATNTYQSNSSTPAVVSATPPIIPVPPPILPSVSHPFYAQWKLDICHASGIDDGSPCETDPIANHMWTLDLSQGDGVAYGTAFPASLTVTTGETCTFNITLTQDPGAITGLGNSTATGTGGTFTLSDLTYVVGSGSADPDCSTLSSMSNLWIAAPDHLSGFEIALFHDFHY